MGEDSTTLPDSEMRKIIREIAAAADYFETIPDGLELWGNLRDEVSDEHVEGTLWIMKELLK